MATQAAPELLIVMGPGATPDQTEHVVARLAEVGVSARVSTGREATVIGAIGDRDLLASLPLEAYPGVHQVLPIVKPYKLVSRELAADLTMIDSLGRRLGDSYFGLIAGPVLRRDARADARDRPRRRRGRRDDAPRRRVQAALVAVLLPGSRAGGAGDPRRGPRGDRAADRHRADGRARRRGGRRRGPT